MHTCKPGGATSPVCVHTPALRIPLLPTAWQVVTVGGSDLEAKFASKAAERRGGETLYRWSNTGACVKIFAPGVEIFAACGGAGRYTHECVWRGGLPGHS